MTEQQPVIEIKDVTKTYTMGEAADLLGQSKGRQRCIDALQMAGWATASTTRTRLVCIHPIEQKIFKFGNICTDITGLFVYDCWQEA